MHFPQHLFPGISTPLPYAGTTLPFRLWFRCYRRCEDGELIDKAAWIELADGRVLSTRSKGKETYCIPGGKREPGESDVDTLVREISEELSVRIDPATAVHVGTFEAQAHGQPEGVVIRLTCCTARYSGTLAPASEIAELVWLSATDTARIAPVDHLVFAHLQAAGLLHP